MICNCKYCKVASGVRRYDVNKEYAHEVARIHQFRSKSKDDGHFRQLLITRAGRCSEPKLRRFIGALEDMGLPEVSGFVRMIMLNK